MSTDRRNGWRRWRDVTFAGCTVWLVLQNVVILTLIAWGRPTQVLAAGTHIAQAAIAVGAQLAVLALAAVLGLALAAWLVHVPGPAADPPTPVKRPPSGSVEART